MNFKPTLNLAFSPEVTLCEASNPFESINIISFDIYSLIDVHDAIIEIIKEHRNKFDYDMLITLADWLYGWYKKMIIILCVEEY